MVTVSVTAQTEKPSEGIYYSHESYAGFWRRLTVDVIDLLVIMTVSVIVTYLISSLTDVTESLVPLLMLTWATLWFSYFVLLKRSRFGTVGYRVCNVRIVNLHGETPGIFSLILRLCYAFVGPLSFPLDLIWISGDADRQALRDKFAKTYVIKNSASPAGAGKIAYSTYDLWGWHLLFCEVKRGERT